MEIASKLCTAMDLIRRILRALGGCSLDLGRGVVIIDIDLAVSPNVFDIPHAPLDPKTSLASVMVVRAARPSIVAVNCVS